VIVLLAGGVGAARFARGLVTVVPPEEITIISNTGDDFHVYGVHVSPDLDIVTYTLAGIVDDERGWGIAGDTFTVLDGLRALGVEAWFSLGDRDFATCAAREETIAAGGTPSSFAARLAARHGVRARVLPMTDDPVETRIGVVDSEGEEADLHFQEYWVRRGAQDRVLGVRLAGAEAARPAPGVLEAIAGAEAVLLAPSNPVVSIGTILSVPGLREALAATPAPVAGISPIIGGAPVRGMADKLMAGLNTEVSCVGVAAGYRDFLDAFVIDLADAARAPEIEAMGVAVAVEQSLMHTDDDAAALAKAALGAAAGTRR
jgi:LPPG:FO 2-phospho-L-lactate transferase